MLLVISLIVSFCQLSSAVITPKPLKLDLLLVQAIWRHGDRSAQIICPKDPIQEKDWIFGGGGLGQLTPIGMRQHFELGQAIRKRYVDDMQFLPSVYDASKVYIRSTDRNRTISSAMSNLLGMYSYNNSNARPDIDYPDIPGWPVLYTPIAVHSQDYDSDCVVNVLCDCPRRIALQNMAHTLPEYVNYTTSSEFLAMLTNLTDYCGSPITASNYWTVPDTLLTERIHFNATLYANNFSEDFYSQIQKINHRLNFFTSGIYQSPSNVNGLDVSLEILKIRSLIVNEMFDRANSKLNCIQNDKECNEFIKNLQYYGYSAHDDTIYSFMTAFGIQDVAAPNPGEWPQYAAALFVELFVDDAFTPYFRLMYRANETSDFVPITSHITGCFGEDYCQLYTFKDIANKYKFNSPFEEWCQVLPTSSGSLNTAILSVLVIFAWYLQNE